MAPEQPTSYGQEEAAYGARETSLSAVFGFPLLQVFNAAEQAVERQSLTTLMSSASNGLLVARPPFSLLNLGRRVNLTFSPAPTAPGSPEKGEATLVRATYTHGLVSFEDRYARLSLLSDLFRSTLLQLEAGNVAREAAKAKAAPQADPQVAPQAAPQVAPPAAPRRAAPPTQEKSPVEAAPPPYPTLNELRAKARLEQKARRGLPAEVAGKEEFLGENPEGFRLPARFRARRIFWFALGMVLAVVAMILLSLSSR